MGQINNDEAPVHIILVVCLAGSFGCQAWVG